MDDNTPGGDGLEPIPGSPDEISRHAERLTELANFMDDLGSRIRQTGISDWLGDAADRSLDVRLRLATQCLRASDLHAAAAAGLRDYWHPLCRLQPMGDMVIADARAVGDPFVVEAARLSLRRWRDELAPIGKSAAHQIRQAAEELEQLRRILPELATVAPPAVALSAPVRSRQPVRVPERSTTPRQQAPSVFAVGDPTYAERVAHLNAEIFLALRDGPTIRLPLAAF